MSFFVVVRNTLKSGFGLNHNCLHKFVFLLLFFFSLTQINRRSQLVAHPPPPPASLLFATCSKTHCRAISDSEIRSSLNHFHQVEEGEGDGRLFLLKLVTLTWVGSVNLAQRSVNSLCLYIISKLFQKFTTQ